MRLRFPTVQIHPTQIIDLRETGYVTNFSPLLQENFNAGVTKTLGQFREQMATLNRFMEKKVVRLLPQIVSHISDRRLELQIAPLKSKSAALAQEVIARAIAQTKIPGIRDYRHIMQIYSLVTSDKVEVESSLRDNYIAVSQHLIL